MQTVSALRCGTSVLWRNTNSLSTPHYTGTTKTGSGEFIFKIQRNERAQINQREKFQILALKVVFQYIFSKFLYGYFRDINLLPNAIL